MLTSPFLIPLCVFLNSCCTSPRCLISYDGNDCITMDYMQPWTEFLYIQDLWILSLWNWFNIKDRMGLLLRIRHSYLTSKSRLNWSTFMFVHTIKISLYMKTKIPLYFSIKILNFLKYCVITVEVTEGSSVRLDHLSNFPL